MEEDIAVNEKPASRRISARRTDAEARMSFMRKLDDNGFLILTEDAAERIGNFADGGVGFDGGKDGGEEILWSGGAALELGKRRFGVRGVTFDAESVQPSDLGALDFRVNTENRNVAVLFCDEIVHANDDLFFFLDSALELVGGFLDFALNEAGFNSAQHSSHRIHFFNVFAGALLDFVGEGF